MRIHFLFSGGHQANEAKVLLVGGGNELARGQIAQKTVAQQRGEAEGGDPRERHALLCLRIHEREPVPAHEGAVRPRGQALPGAHDTEHDVPGG